MTRFGRIVLGGFLGALLVVSEGMPSGALAAEIDFDGIEIEEESQQAVLAMDVPADGTVEPSNRPDQGEMTLTFRDVSINVPRRVHRGTEGLLHTVDLEPWFMDGQRLTRMVVRYEPGAVATFRREGDIVVVTVSSDGADPDIAESMAAMPDQMAEMASDDEGSMSATDMTSMADEASSTETVSATDEVESSSESTTSASNESSETGAFSWTPIIPAAAATEGSDRVADDVRPNDASPEVPEDAASSDEVAATERETSSSSDESWGDEARQSSADDDVESAEPTESRDAASTEPASNSKSSDDDWKNDPWKSTGESDEAWKAAVNTASAKADQSDEWTIPPRADQSAVSTYDAASSGANTAPSNAVAARAAAAGTETKVWLGPTPPDTQPNTAVVEIGPAISIDLQGADIQTVLRSIAETAGKNIVANSDVRGTVTLKLKDTPWRRALEIILRTQGLGYVEELGVIRVASAEQLQQEGIARETAARKKDELVPLQTDVMTVRFAAARELLEPLSGRVSPRGMLNVDMRTNTLIVTDIPANLPQIRGLVQQLDTKTPQIEIVAKLVDLDTGTLRELGVQWGLTNLHSTPYAVSGNASVSELPTQSSGQINVGIIRSWADLDVTLTALETTNKANIISNPKITTLNNREASILVGQEIPLNVQDESGNTITELKKIGIGLRVTPYVNEGDLITMDLHPQVSDLASESSAATGVIINTSEADTRVMVRDGETAVIGGLIRSNDLLLETGVPILKDLPIVGALFRSQSKAEAKRELVIFVTPRIIH